MLYVSASIKIPDDELDFSAIRAQGAGGQNVNKVSTAIHLRFDIGMSSLADSVKQQLLDYKDQRINKDGVIVIKAQRFRSQDKNREDALSRLAELVSKATEVQKTRRATKATKGSQRRRMDSKTLRGRTKALRGKPAI